MNVYQLDTVLCTKNNWSVFLHRYCDSCSFMWLTQKLLHSYWFLPIYRHQDHAYGSDRCGAFLHSFWVQPPRANKWSNELSTQKVGQQRQLPLNIVASKAAALACQWQLLLPPKVPHTELPLPRFEFALAAFLSRNPATENMDLKIKVSIFTYSSFIGFNYVSHIRWVLFYFPGPTGSPSYSDAMVSICRGDVYFGCLPWQRVV